MDFSVQSFKTMFEMKSCGENVLNASVAYAGSRQSPPGPSFGMNATTTSEHAPCFRVANTLAKTDLSKHAAQQFVTDTLRSASARCEEYEFSLTEERRRPGIRTGLGASRSGPLTSSINSAGVVSVFGLFLALGRPQMAPKTENYSALQSSTNREITH
jgi:hypothetical protein